MRDDRVDWTGTAKADVRNVLSGLPDDCPLEDIERELHTRYPVDCAAAIGQDCVPGFGRRLGHHPEMLEGSAKEEVLEVLDLLDDTCTIADVYDTLSVRERIREGLWSLQHEQTCTQEEVEQSLERWLRD